MGVVGPAQDRDRRARGGHRQEQAPEVRRGGARRQEPGDTELGGPPRDQHAQQVQPRIAHREVGRAGRRQPAPGRQAERAAPPPARHAPGQHQDQPDQEDTGQGRQQGGQRQRDPRGEPLVRAGQVAVEDGPREQPGRSPCREPPPATEALEAPPHPPEEGHHQAQGQRLAEQVEQRGGHGGSGREAAQAHRHRHAGHAGNPEPADQIEVRRAISARRRRSASCVLHGPTVACWMLRKRQAGDRPGAQ
jgi:hypothetical protein